MFHRYGWHLLNCDGSQLERGDLACLSVEFYEEFEDGGRLECFIVVGGYATRPTSTVVDEANVTIGDALSCRLEPLLEYAIEHAVVDVVKVRGANLAGTVFEEQWLSYDAHGEG
jgi:hypothetical protein